MSKFRAGAMAVGLAVAALLIPAPLQAAEPDSFLPTDTEQLMVFNFRQFLGSALMKKIGLDNIRDALMNDENIGDALKDMGIDPLKDIDRMLIAGPTTSDQDKGLIIVHGKFDLDKIKTKMEKLAKDKSDDVKQHKVKDGQGGEHTIWETNIPGAPTTLFIGLASKTTVLAGMSKDYLVDGLKVKAGAKPTLKSKQFQDLLAKLDDQQSMSLIVAGENLGKELPADVPGREILAKIKALAGGVAVTDGIKIELTLSTKNADDAKELKEKVSEGVNTAMAFLALAAQQQKELAGLVEALKSIKVTSKDKDVSLKGEISAETLNKMINKDF